MVAQHPSKPGRFVLAIECDGATYHSQLHGTGSRPTPSATAGKLGVAISSHLVYRLVHAKKRGGSEPSAMQAFQAALNYADKLDAGFMRTGDDGSGRPEKSKTNGVSPSAKERARRPAIPMRTSIAQYSPYEQKLSVDLWLASDGQLRTDDEIMTEMISVLGFRPTSGARIETAIKSALQTYRAIESRPSGS